MEVNKIYYFLRGSLIGKKATLVEVLRSNRGRATKPQHLYQTGILRSSTKFCHNFTLLRLFDGIQLVLKSTWVWSAKV